MEIVNPVKPSAPAAVAGPTRVEPPGPAPATRTELPPDAAVQPMDEESPVRFEDDAGARSRAAIDQVMRDAIRRRLEIDPDSREVVQRSINERTGEVVAQIPEEAILRLRVLAREMTQAQAASSDTPPHVEKVA